MLKADAAPPGPAGSSSPPCPPPPSFPPLTSSSPQRLAAASLPEDAFLQSKCALRRFVRSSVAHHPHPPGGRHRAPLRRPMKRGGNRTTAIAGFLLISGRYGTSPRNCPGAHQPHRLIPRLRPAGHGRVAPGGRRSLRKPIEEAFLAAHDTAASSSTRSAVRRQMNEKPSGGRSSRGGGRSHTSPNAAELPHCVSPRRPFFPPPPPFPAPTACQLPTRGGPLGNGPAKAGLMMAQHAQAPRVIVLGKRWLAGHSVS